MAINTPAAQAAKKATSTVPIVIMRVADPVKSGLIASLARPGGNVTGMYFMLDELGAKGLELLHEIAPAISNVGILYQADNPASPDMASATEARGSKLGLRFMYLKLYSSLMTGQSPNSATKSSASPRVVGCRSSRSTKISPKRAVLSPTDQTWTSSTATRRITWTRSSEAPLRAIYPSSSRRSSIC